MKLQISTPTLLSVFSACLFSSCNALTGFPTISSPSPTPTPTPSPTPVAPQITFNGTSTYTSINPSISFSIADNNGSIQSLTFQLDPQTSPWAVEQQSLPSNPSCQISNGSCTSSLSFSNLYATPHTLVLTATDSLGLQTVATYLFTITLPLSQQIAAANTAATTNFNCVGTGGDTTGITPFYWEIGNASSGSAPLASGSVIVATAPSPSPTPVLRTTQFEIDSSSKMISGAFILSQPGVQAWSSSVPAASKQFLHFASGYTHFQDDSCSVRGLSTSTNNVTAAEASVFDCYSACCIVNNSNSVIKDGVALGGGELDLCGNLVNHTNAASMIASLEASGVINSTDAALGPNVTCNNDYVASTAGSFYYSGGHLQRFSVAANTTLAPNPGDGFSNYGIDLTGLIGDKGLTGSTSLATAFLTVFNQLGLASGFQFAFPQMAGGVYSDAGSYATILQNILSGSFGNYLSYLGQDPVCAYTQQNAINANYTGVKIDQCTSATGYAQYTPITASLFHYSYTDWIEDDPTTGDSAYSSAGKDGEYPWIDASKTYYGIVHRSDSSGASLDGHSPVGQGYQSLLCGRQIRKAFFTGTNQP